MKSPSEKSQTQENKRDSMSINQQKQQTLEYSNYV